MKAPALATALAIALVALAVSATSPLGEASEVSTLTAKRVKPKAGAYKGKTAQARKVTFRVKRGRVGRARIYIRRRGCGVRYTFTGTDRVNRRGRFSLGSKGSTYLRGRFTTKSKVRGEAGIDFSAVACGGRKVRSVKFRARRKA